MSYQYFDELPDDAKGKHRNKLSLLGKIIPISLVFYLFLFFKVHFHLPVWSNFDTRCWSKIQNVD